MNSEEEPIRCGTFSETAETGAKVMGSSKQIAERALAYQAVADQLLARYAELFPNYAWTDPATAIDLMAAEITTLRFELAVNKPVSLQQNMTSVILDETPTCRSENLLVEMRKHICSFDERESGCPVCHDIDELENEIRWRREI